MDALFMVWMSCHLHMSHVERLELLQSNVKFVRRWLISKAVCRRLSSNAVHAMKPLYVSALNWLLVIFLFLADLTNGHTYARVLCLSSLSVTLCIVAKRWVIEQKLIQWSRDRWRHVTPKGQTRDPSMFRAQYLENSCRCYLATISNCRTR